MPNVNELINQIPQIQRNRRPAPQPDKTKETLAQVLPLIVSLVGNDSTKFKHLEDISIEKGKDLSNGLAQLVELLRQIEITYVKNNNYELIKSLIDEFNEVLKKIPAPVVNIDFPTDEIAEVKASLDKLPSKMPSIFKVSNLSDVSDAIESLKPILISLKQAIGDLESSYELNSGTEFPKEVIDLLSHLKNLKTDANNPLAVRLTDGKEFYKGLATAINDGVKIMGSGSGTSFQDPNGSPQKAKLDTNLAVRVTQSNYTVKIELSGTDPIYVAEALPGTLTSASGWSIRKITYSGGVATDVKWADGTNAFSKIYDNRASYTYS